MKRHNNMSKWYPLEGYPYADVNCSTRIEKMLDKIRKIKNKDTMSEAEKQAEIRNTFEAITELAFEHETRYDVVVDYIDWLYMSDEDAAALDLALKLFATMREMVNPKIHEFESVCDWVETIADATDSMTDELEDALISARSYIMNA